MEVPVLLVNKPFGVEDLPIRAAGAGLRGHLAQPNLVQQRLSVKGKSLHKGRYRYDYYPRPSCTACACRTDSPRGVYYTYFDRDEQRVSRVGLTLISSRLPMKLYAFLTGVNRTRRRLSEDIGIFPNG